ncbi:hypothetical protein ACLOJK_037342 [Asimina triloba]
MARLGNASDNCPLLPHFRSWQQQRPHLDRRAAMMAAAFVSIRSDGQITMIAVDSVSTAFDFQIRLPRWCVRLLHQCLQQITATNLETN